MIEILTNVAQDIIQNPDVLQPLYVPASVAVALISGGLFINGRLKRQEKQCKKKEAKSQQVTAGHLQQGIEHLGESQTSEKQPRTRMQIKQHSDIGADVTEKDAAYHPGRIGGKQQSHNELFSLSDGEVALIGDAADATLLAESSSNNANAHFHASNVLAYRADHLAPNSYIADYLKDLSLEHGQQGEIAVGLANQARGLDNEAMELAKNEHVKHTGHHSPMSGGEGETYELPNTIIGEDDPSGGLV